MIASGTVHRLNAARESARPATSQTPATTLDVTQSQTTPASPADEQPQGLDAMTKADRNSAAIAQAPKTNAILVVARASRAGGRAEITNSVYVGTSSH
jgi:hypothetical protein